MIPVLYVDDEKNLLEIGRIFLERTGDFQVDVAGSAREGLSQLESGKYAAIISDYQMPGMDGIAFLREVRAQNPDIPFLLFTGRGREEVVIQALEHGADFYIQKGGDPVAQFAELRHKLLQAVRQREAERALRESQERHALTLEALNEGLWDWNLVTGEAAFSDRYFRMLGYEPGEIPGSYAGWQGCVHPEDLAVVEERIRHRIEQGKGYTIEFRMRARDGEWRWIHARGEVITFDGSGRALRMVGTHQDVTELRAAERQRERANRELARNLETLAASERRATENEARYRRIVETAYEGIWILDAEFVTVVVNERMAELLGYPRDALIGRSVAEFVVEEEQEDHEARCAERRAGVPGAYERRLRRRDGSVLWTHVSANPAFNEAGQFSSSFAMFTDITERKQAELDLVRANEDLGSAYEEMSAINEELEESMDELRQREQHLFEQERFLEGLIEHANVPIVVWDADGRIVRFNRAAERLTGRAATDAIGMPIEELFSPAHRETARRECARTNAGAPWEDVLLPVLQQGGGVRDLAWNSAPLYGRDGRTLEAVIAQGRDLTVERQTADALLVANRKLHLLSSLTRHDVQNRLLAAEGFLELVRISNQDNRLVHPLDRVAATLAEIRQQMAFARDYQDLGTNAPGWHDLGRTGRRDAHPRGRGRRSRRRQGRTGASLRARSREEHRPRPLPVA